MTSLHVQGGKTLHIKYFEVKVVFNECNRESLYKPSTTLLSGKNKLEKHDEVMVSIRQIIRAIDLKSKQLNKAVGLTTPQLMLMQAIDRHGDVSLKVLAEQTNISQATASTILDRLESRQLVIRVRSLLDKRRQHAELTEAGKSLLLKAPTALQENFVARFQALPEWEQNMLLASVQRISALMNAEHLDVAPVLETGTLTKEDGHPK